MGVGGEGARHKARQPYLLQAGTPVAYCLSRKTSSPTTLAQQRQEASRTSHKGWSPKPIDFRQQAWVWTAGCWAGAGSTGHKNNPTLAVLSQLSGAAHAA